MKESDRPTDGQIVSYKYQWLVCYMAADNHLLFDFAIYMQIYNNAWQTADVLGNDLLLAHAIGVIGEITPSIEPYLSGFAHKKDIIATDQRIEEFQA